MFRITSGSNVASIRVLAVATDSKVLEKTTLSAARQVSAKSTMAGCRSPMKFVRLPTGHRFVHAPAVKICTDRPLELVDQGEHLFIWFRPIKIAVLVLDVAIE